MFHPKLVSYKDNILCLGFMESNLLLCDTGTARQYPELLPQHHCQRDEEVPQEDSWRYLWPPERGGHLQHPQDGGQPGPDEGRQQV